MFFKPFLLASCVCVVCACARAQILMVKNLSHPKGWRSLEIEIFLIEKRFVRKSSGSFGRYLEVQDATRKQKKTRKIK